MCKGFSNHVNSGLTLYHPSSTELLSRTNQRMKCRINRLVLFSYARLTVRKPTCLFLCSLPRLEVHSVLNLGLGDLGRCLFSFLFLLLFKMTLRQCIKDL